MLPLWRHNSSSKESHKEKTKWVNDYLYNRPWSSVKVQWLPLPLESFWTAWSHQSPQEPCCLAQRADSPSPLWCCNDHLFMKFIKAPHCQCRWSRLITGKAVSVTTSLGRLSTWLYVDWTGVSICSNEREKNPCIVHVYVRVWLSPF